MTRLKCPCGKEAYSSHLNNLWKIECPECNRRTAWYKYLDDARKEWEKDDPKTTD